MATKTKSIKINAILNIIRSILSIIFPLITYPYVSRVLQPDNLGKINFAGTYVGYFSLLAVLGLVVYAGREGIQFRDDRKKMSEFASEIFSLNMLTTLSSYALLTITVLLVPKFQSYIWLIVIYSSTIIFSTLGVEWIYTIYEDYLHITIRSIVTQVVSLVLLFVFVKDANGMYIYASLNVLASVGGNIWNFFYSKKYINYKFKLTKSSFRHLKPALIFFASSIASSIYSNIDITMLGFFKDDFTVGIYSVAVKFYVMLKTVLVAITSVSTPRLTYYKSLGDDNAFNSLLSKIIKVVITLMIPMVVGVILVSNDLIVILCGAEYIGSVPCLQLLSIAIIMSIFASIINGCVLLPNKLEKIALLGTVSAAIVNALLNIFAIPWLGAQGAAITTILAEFTVLVIGVCFARKFAKLQNISKTLIVSVVSSLLMLIPAGVITHLITELPILRMCLTIICCATLYFVVSLIAKNEVVIEFIKTLGSKIKKKNEKN